MGRLHYLMNVSLDGYVSDPDGNFDWSEPDRELHRHFNELQRGIAVDVYGRRMWETMSYWADPPPEALADPVTADFADAWQATHSVVVSRTLESVDGATLWRDLSQLDDLVQQTDGVVSISGPTIAADALRAGLVDEVTAYAAPHIAGEGLRFLPEGYAAKLRLRETKELPGEVVLLGYDVVTR
ncbi:deaminase [Epidermidibacterium keratini]|uniref:Deaminase n=1 Tax=Epidermidibacterium keratini TaxID=1891644 RepID=A0A7L4YQD4_9ACTN|nr:dihydrofolate reductase family protein [Epidermidibacterium keratini]QHC01471.1 deaminase [Epidermidibacterium keratini]